MSYTILEEPKAAGYTILGPAEPAGFSVLGAAEPQPQPQAVPTWIGPQTSVPLSQLEGGPEYISLVHRNQASRMGFSESIQGWSARNIPFAGDAVDAKNIYGVIRTHKKLERGDHVSDQSLLAYNRYFQEQARLENATTLGKVGETLKGMTKFWTEIGAIVGATLFVGEGIAGEAALVEAKVGGAAAKETALQAAKRLFAGRTVKAAYQGVLSRSRDAAAAGIKNVAKNVIKTQLPEAAVLKFANLAVASADIAAKGAALTLLNPGAAQRSVAERKLANVLRGDDEDAHNAVVLGIADAWIEHGTEMAGVHLGRATKNLLNVVPAGGGKRLGDLIVGGGIIRHLNKKYGASGLAGFSRVLDAVGAGATALRFAGANSLIEELGEERLGGFLRGLTGVSGKAGLVNALNEMWPTWEQSKVELLAFSVPGLVGGTVSYAREKNIMGAIKFQQNMSNSARIDSDLERLTSLNPETVEGVNPERLAAAVAREAKVYRDNPDSGAVAKALGRITHNRNVSVANPLNQKRKIDLVNYHEVVRAQNIEKPDAEALAREAVAGQIREYQRVQTESAMTEAEAANFDDLVDEEKAVKIEYSDRKNDSEYVLASGVDLGTAQVDAAVRSGRVRGLVDVRDPDVLKVLEVGAANVSQSWEQMGELEQNEWIGILSPSTQGKLFDSPDTRRMVRTKYETLRQSVLGFQAERDAPIEQGALVNVADRADVFYVEKIQNDNATLSGANGELLASTYPVAALRRHDVGERVYLTNRVVPKGTKAEFAARGYAVPSRAKQYKDPSRPGEAIHAMPLGVFNDADGSMFVSGEAETAETVSQIVGNQLRVKNLRRGKDALSIGPAGQEYLAALNEQIDAPSELKDMLAAGNAEGRFEVYQRAMTYRELGHGAQGDPLYDEIKGLGAIPADVQTAARAELDSSVGRAMMSHIGSMPKKSVSEALEGPEVAEVGVGIAPVAEVAPTPSEAVVEGAEPAVAPEPEVEAPEVAEPAPEAPPEPVATLSDGQRRLLFAAGADVGLSADDVIDIARRTAGVESMKDVPANQVDDVMDAIRATTEPEIEAAPPGPPVEEPVIVEGERPKKAVTPETEIRLVKMHDRLVAAGTMSEKQFEDILNSMNLKVWRFQGPKAFITESRATELIKRMTDMAPVFQLQQTMATARATLPAVEEEYNRVIGVFAEKYGDKLAKHHSLLDMHHFMDDFQKQTGLPWGSVQQRIFDHKHEAVIEIRDILDRVRAAGGQAYDTIIHTPESVARIEQYMASKLPEYVKGKPDAPEDITPDERRIADTMTEVLKEYEAVVRYERFFEWRDRGTEIPNATAQDLEEANRILEENVANPEGDAILRAYLAGKDWGVVRTGYDIGEVFRAATRAGKRKPSVSRAHLQPRESVEFQDKERNIIERFQSYVRQMTYRTRLRRDINANRAMFNTYNDRFDDPKAVGGFLDDNLSEVLEQRRSPGPLERFVLLPYSQASRAIFLDPRKGVRNLFQNFALYTGLEDFGAIAKLSEEDLRYFSTYVAQERGIHRDFLFTQYKVNFPVIKQLNQLADYFDVMGRTDRANRLLSFKLKLGAMQKAMEANPDFATNPESLKKMMKSAGFGDMQPMERLHALDALAVGGPGAMSRYVARAVTQKVHFLYERMLRSPAEQGTELRKILSNLFTFRKGFAQRLLLDFRQMVGANLKAGEGLGVEKRAMRSMIGATVFAAMVGKVYQILTGDDKRNPYAIKEILSDMSLGGLATGVQEDVGKFTYDLWDAASGDKAAGGRLVNDISRALDMMIPFYRMSIDAMEAIADIQGLDRKVLREIRAALDSRVESKPDGFYDNERSLIEKAQHVAFGT